MHFPSNPNRQTALLIFVRVTIAWVVALMCFHSLRSTMPWLGSGIFAAAVMLRAVWHYTGRSKQGNLQSSASLLPGIATAAKENRP